MESRTSESYAKKKQYSMEYAKQKYKRIPLDVTYPKYDEIKCYADKAGDTVNGFIKSAIDAKIKSMQDKEQ